MIIYRKFGREDYDSAEFYHLVLNMSKLNLEKAFQVVLKLLENGGA